MHYGIIGLGPVGATFACLLHAGGHEVSTLDINPYRCSLLSSGPLKLTGHYEAETQLENVFSSFKEFAASDPDVILIAVKTPALQDIIDRIGVYPRLCSKAIVSAQNGIDNEYEIAEAFGEDHAYRAVLNFGVSYSAKNVISVNFLNEPHYLSSVSPEKADVAKRIVQELSDAGFGFQYVKDIRTESFKKAILNTTLSSICTLTRMRMAEVMGDPELLEMVKELIRENVSICEALNIDLGRRFAEEAVAYLQKGGHHKPSMLVDIEDRQQTEIAHLAGKLFEFAKQEHLSVPVTQTMYYLVKSLEASVMLSRYVNNPPE
jgi:2-dehydropantoate 2-reductase